MRSYIEALRKAGAVRRAAAAILMRGVILVVCASVLAYIALSLALVPADEPREWNFFSEQGSITAFSAVLLAMGSGLAGAAFLFVRRHGATGGLVLLLLAGGLGFLALDELLEIHEKAGGTAEGAVGGFRSWNDILVVAYGVAGLAFLLWALPTLARLPRVTGLLLAAFACYAAHTLIDSTQQPPTTASVVLEESAKLFCSAFLALAMLAALLSVAGTNSAGD